MSQAGERLARLPALEQRALLLITADGLSYDDAAQRLGVGIDALHSILDSARDAIARMIVKEAET
jgi:DNA-directed RNA polymerase specialized sigma24 family protein